MKEEEVRERDKRLAAAHEAGHFVVAVYLGQLLSAKIEETGSSDLSSDRAWVGQVEQENGDWTPAIAVAGELAVALIEEPDYWMDSYAFVEDMMDEIREDPDFLSPTDKAAFPEDENQQRLAIAQAAEILRNNEAFFVWVTRELYQRSEIPTARLAMACEFENNNCRAWQKTQLDLLLNRFNQLVAEVRELQKSPDKNADAIAAAEQEAGRLKNLLEIVAQRINIV